MPHIFKAFLTCTLLLSSIFSCASLDEVNSEEETATTDTPTWYNTANFSSDSLAFHGYAQAISSDSIIAVANARIQAKAHLEVSLSEIIEDYRAQAEENGENTVTDPDFIITLRNASQSVQEQAASTQGAAINKGEHFLGFAQVTISKDEFRDLIQSHLRETSGYWESIKNAPVFSE
jgi:hypothetical protein